MPPRLVLAVLVVVFTSKCALTQSCPQGMTRVPTSFGSYCEAIRSAQTQNSSDTRAANTPTTADESAFLNCNHFFTKVLIFEGASSSTKVVRTGACGDRVMIVRDEGGWVRIRLLDRTEGYVAFHLLSKSEDYAKASVGMQQPSAITPTQPEPKRPGKWKRALQGFAQGAAAAGQNYAANGGSLNEGLYSLTNVRRADKDLYTAKSGTVNLVIVTKYCYQYAYGEDGVLKYEGRFGDNKIIFDDHEVCEVEKVAKTN